MTTLAAASPDALPALGALAAAHGIECTVQTGLADPDAVAQVAALAREGVAIDADPGRVARARTVLQAHGLRGVRVLQGHPPRVLADLRRQLPARTLWFLAAGDVPVPTVRDSLFWVPRGEGLVAVVLDPSAGVGLADVEDQLVRWSPDHGTEVLAGPDGRALLVAWPQPRVHVTFLIEKYTHGYGTSGLSINLDNLVATLAATGLATYDVVHYDERFHEGRPLRPEDLAPPPGTAAHLLVCTCHYHSHANPDVALLRAAKANGSKVAFVWLDKKISRSTPAYHDVADVNVVLDGNDFELPNAWPVFTPKNPVWFHDPGLPRDIDVSLVGEVRYLGQRKAYAARLAREDRIPVEVFPTSAADTGRALSLAEYARIYQRSKISIALTKDAVRQLKGRVFEILHCGALLVCDVNHHLDAYFRAGRDYVVYRDYEDLVRKCAYYLAHEDERAAIARAGHARATRFCSHHVFWRGLLARAGASAAALRGTMC